MRVEVIVLVGLMLVILIGFDGSFGEVRFLMLCFFVCFVFLICKVRFAGILLFVSTVLVLFL